MSDYTVKQAALSRTPCTLVVLTMDKCSLTYGTAPCTATAADKCYNTFPTCRDRANYARTTQDLKFTTHEAPLPFKAGERPYVSKVDYLPTEIKTSLSVRGRATVDMVDEPDGDVGVDPYLSSRESTDRSVYPPAQSDAYVKATTKGSTNFWPHFATDPSKNLTGASAGNSWGSSSATNQRFRIDAGRAIVPGRLYYENFHNSGLSTENGAKTVILHGSNDAAAFADLTYATDTGWTQITMSQETLDQHVAADTADPKYSEITGAGEYRYFDLKIADNWGGAGYMGLRRVEVQEAVVAIPPASYWKKFIARNGNFKGRPLKIYDGFVGLTENDFATEGKRFTGKIDNIKMGKGKVQIEAVDLLASLSDVSIPEKLNIKLAVDLSIDATQATLSGDDVDSLDAAPGYVRIDDEIITYGAITYGTKIISSLTRGAFGTTAAAHNDKGKVQKCRRYAADNPFDLMQTILDDGGIAAGDIDTAAFTAAKDFDTDQDVAAIISEPVKASDLFFELVELMACKAWVNEDLQVTIARDLPNHPDWTYSTLTDAENFLQDSASVDLNQKSLITRCSIYWQKNPVADEDKVTSYARLNVAVDTDAEGVSEYDQEAEKVIYSRWLDSALGNEDDYLLWVASLAARIMWPHRDPMPILEVDVEIKDAGIMTGDVVHVDTDELCDRYGNDFEGVAFQVIKREKGSDGKITLKLLRLTPKRILYIAPDDAPDYATATEAQKEQYGYISDDNGQMADGKDGYVIF